MNGKKIKNIELVTIALYEVGGANNFKDTEDVAVKADEIDNERFKWRNKKYKKYIDRGLIVESLNAARVRRIGSFLKGNDDKGWILTPIGLEFCKRGGYFLPEDASRFVGDDDSKNHSKYGFNLTSDSNGPRWDKTGDAFPTPVPEQVIGTSHLLLNHEGDIDFNNRKSLMAEYFSVVPVDDLGWYNLGQKKKVEWREGHVGDPGRWQWAEQKMSVAKSIGEIE